MALSLYNTLGRTKQEFVPIKPGHVGLYSCGPTVYNYVHIGNLRSYVLSDILRRTLEYNKYEVKQIINITDVGHLTSDADEGEDKIEAEAKKTGRTATDIATFYTEAFYADIAKLNIKTAGTIFPKASEHIAEQIEIIKQLETKGFTYQTSDGIYFDTAKYPKYAELGMLNLAGQKEGARVEVNTEKRNSSDFGLWKFSSGESRLQEWESPWGKGFPGWHIECSAMSMKYLGHHFDIHTGGIDHIPVHHTNERAQSECATGEPYANYWLHNDFVMVDNQKMSKSLGNTYRITILEEKNHAPLAYRYWLLTAHYRTMVNFTWDALAAAESAYNKLTEIMLGLTATPTGTVSSAYQAEFEQYINDDLNTPQALALVWKLVKDDAVSPADKKATLLNFDQVLGLGLAEVTPLSIPAEVQALVTAREQARTAKDWSKSDDLRVQIKSLGYEVKDTDSGQKLSAA